jgi:hypothetical protein
MTRSGGNRRAISGCVGRPDYASGSAIIDRRRDTARIEFIKGESTRYRSLLHRPDGVTI